MSSDYSYHPVPVNEPTDDQTEHLDGAFINALARKDEDELLITKPIPLDTIELNNRITKHQSSFDRLFCRRFLRILRILFSPVNPNGNLILIWTLFITMSLSKEIAVYYAGIIPSKFYKVLVGQDLEGFKMVTIFSVVVVLGAGLGMSLMKLIGSFFSLSTRKVLTKHLQDRYIKSDSFYRLLVTRADIDNPDQRITQDVDRFSETLRSVCEEIMVAPVLIAYYTYQTWNLGGFLGPAMIYLYFLIGLVASKFMITPLVNLVFMKEFYEGNFRFLHVRAFQSSESIVLGWAEKAEKTRLDTVFNKLLEYTRQIIEREFVLQTFTYSFAYFGSIVSYLVIAIPIFTGAYDNVEKGELSSIISMNAFFSMYLINKFTNIIDQSAKISDLAGYTSRIGQLLEALDDINMELENVDIDHPFEEQQNSELSILFDHVSFTTPSGYKPLLSDFKFLIEQEKNVMIIGPNGSGKSSILRVMCGLWPVVRGRVLRPNLHFRQKMLMYLPQTPYLVFGSLRDQITYPMINDEKIQYATDKEVENLLAKVGLTHLKNIVSNYDAQFGLDWNKLLSPGEQQKLSFARLFFWKPVFAALDESTCLLDSTTESRFFELCKEDGITCITVSHNKNLLKYHDKVLLLDGKGHYATSDIDINGSGDIERWISHQLSNAK
ncbi:12629_t:CDS:10 [Acaulospora morrowiae]|uniref:12629_t:CDS:1 n=1 Tax=Acaulospora morrowiae TaxID=94023 RepID=A0A9N9BGP3_9GLOM|nr:12629_t:CDS:10 [Acaulospora morrowiae]